MKEDKSPNLKFINNRLLKKIKNSNSLDKINHQKKLDIWAFDDEYPALIWDDIKSSELYTKLI